MAAAVDTLCITVTPQITLEQITSTYAGSGFQCPINSAWFDQMTFTQDDESGSTVINIANDFQCEFRSLSDLPQVFADVGAKYNVTYNVTSNIHSVVTSPMNSVRMYQVTFFKDGRLNTQDVHEDVYRSRFQDPVNTVVAPA